MRRELSLIATAAAVVLAGCGADSTGEFRPDGGGFAIYMPTQPRKEVTELDLPLGHLQVVGYVSGTNQITFAVHYTDYPASMTTGRTADAMLDPGIEQTISRHPHASNWVERTVYQGFPARNATIIDPDSGYTVMVKAFLVGNRTYTIVAAMPSDTPATQEVPRFMNSFRLVTNRGR
jgi:hypothetical protein